MKQESWSYEFDEYGGYDCMTAGYRILAGNQVITVIDVGDYHTPLEHDDSTPWSETEAHAKLITAAPVMLGALKLAKKLADAVVEQISGDNIEVLMTRATINEAILKATE